MRPTRYYPRWRNWLYAQLHGYFWLPCPSCGQNRGGHEGGGTLMMGWSDGVGVCPKPSCMKEAERRNARFMKDNPHPAMVYEIR